MSYPFSAISSWQEAVLIAGTNILTQFFGFIPKLFGALVIFLFGLILARWSKVIIIKILSAIKLDKILRDSGLEPYLDRADVRVKAEVFIGEIVKWLIMAVFLSPALMCLV